MIRPKTLFTRQNSRLNSSSPFAVLLIAVVMLSCTGPAMGQAHAAAKNVLWDLTHGIFLDYEPARRYSQLASMLAGNGYTVDNHSNHKVFLATSEQLRMGSEPQCPTDMVCCSSELS